MKDKKEAMVLEHHDPRKMQGTLTRKPCTIILPRILRQIKQLLCRMLCILLALLGVLGLGTWCKGWRPLWQAALIAAVCGFLAAALYRYGEKGERR